MMIDVSTISSLELVQNLQNLKSKDCLFGHLNETLTPMGARLLRSNILQPLTDADVLATRYAAVDDLTKKEELFFSTRAGSLEEVKISPPSADQFEALKNFLDGDRILAAVSMLIWCMMVRLTNMQLVVTPNKVTLATTEQSINQVIMLKQFVSSINPVYEALTGTASNMLNHIREVRRLVV